MVVSQMWIYNKSYQIEGYKCVQFFYVSIILQIAVKVHKNILQSRMSIWNTVTQNSGSMYSLL